MEIKVLGGARKVGGNRILVKSGNTFFWFDLGHYHPYKLQLYDLNIVRGFSLDRLVSENVFPKQPIYASSKEENGNRFINLFLSHAHADHYGLLNYFKAWQQAGISVRLFSNNNLFKILKTRLELGNLGRCLDYIDYRDVKEAEEENLDVVPINVDHSIDASYGYVVESKTERIGYTGDYRFTTEKDFDNMVKTFQDVDVLITEGTRVSSYTLLTELDVKEKIKTVMDKYWDSTVVFVVGWYTYTTRVRSIIEASGGRKIVLHSKIARLLHSVDESLLSKKNVYVLQMRGEEIPSNSTPITVQEINDQKGNVVVVVPEAQKLYMWREPTPESILVRPDDVVIASLSEPYDEESIRTIHNLSDFVLKNLKAPIYHIHASGHAPLYQIADFVNECKPKKVYIIHSYVPEALGARISKNIKVEIPK